MWTFVVGFGLASAAEGALRVVVTDEEGIQIPNVTLVSRDADRHAQERSTDANGEATFTELPAGQYSVVATKDGFGGVTVEGILVADDRTTVVGVDLEVAEPTCIFMCWRPPTGGLDAERGWVRTEAMPVERSLAGAWSRVDLGPWPWPVAVNGLVAAGAGERAPTVPWASVASLRADPRPGGVAPRALEALVEPPWDPGVRVAGPQPEVAAWGPLDDGSGTTSARVAVEGGESRAVGAASARFGFPGGGAGVLATGAVDDGALDVLSVGHVSRWFKASVLTGRVLARRYVARGVTVDRLTARGEGWADHEGLTGLAAVEVGQHGVVGREPVEHALARASAGLDVSSNDWWRVVGAAGLGASHQRRGPDAATELGPRLSLGVEGRSLSLLGYGSREPGVWAPARVGADIPAADRLGAELAWHSYRDQVWVGVEQLDSARHLAPERVVRVGATHPHRDGGLSAQLAVDAHGELAAWADGSLRFRGLTVGGLCVARTSPGLPAPPGAAPRFAPASGPHADGALRLAGRHRALGLEASAWARVDEGGPHLLGTELAVSWAP